MQAPSAIQCCNVYFPLVVVDSLQIVSFITFWVESIVGLVRYHRTSTPWVYTSSSVCNGRCVGRVRLFWIKISSYGYGHHCWDGWGWLHVKLSPLVNTVLVVG